MQTPVCSDSEPESIVVPHRRRKRALSDDSTEEEEESSHSGVITPELLTPVTKQVTRCLKPVPVFEIAYLEHLMYVS